MERRTLTRSARESATTNGSVVIKASTLNLILGAHKETTHATKKTSSGGASIGNKL